MHQTPPMCRTQSIHVPAGPRRREKSQFVMPTDKPHFECPVEARHRQDGLIEFLITLRDGSIHVVPGLPVAVYTKLPMGITAHQAEGSDTVTLGGANPVTHGR
jgi:hypothetical protein